MPPKTKVLIFDVNETLLDLSKIRISINEALGSEADEFKVFKPHPKTYLGAAQNLGVMPEDCIMIAAHAWDLAGAKKAGLVTAFIERNGQSIYSLSPVHDFTGQDLKRIAEQLIKPL